METLNGHVMNLANSIIGVSVLAMPYCFKQCGIILSVILLIISSIVSRLTCHFLLKSSIISRRKTFEFLAFYLFGRLGKLAIEIGMIGFLLGTCIAYFVVMGDLGPVIVSEITKSNISNTMHTSILMALALFVVLPLGLLRNVHSLNGVSRATMVFYCCLVLKVIIAALPKLFSDDWLVNVNLWKPEGLLQCIPIFSMALFCQTQLFEIYEVVPNATLDKMNGLIRIAVNFCTGVYICVGIFGYIAFSDKNFTGNVLLSFEPTFISHVLKVGFIFSVAFSFPLVIFPCRASLYSLLYKEGYSVHEGGLNYIAEGKFKALTFIIVFVSLVIAILIPNIELVLGLVGSTIGVMVCVLFPVTCFICVSQKNTNERILAQIILAIGIFVMVVGTYKNIQRVDQLEPVIMTNKAQIDTEIMKKLPPIENLALNSEKLKITPTVDNSNKEVRHEPPQPIEPIDEELFKKIGKSLPRKLNDTKNDQVDIEAIKKEDKEEQLGRKDEELLGRKDEVDNHKVLIDTIQKQNEVQKEIVEQQKQLLEAMKKQEEEKKNDEVKKEKMKAVKEIESIALKAIEKISDGEDSKKVVEDLKKGIEKKELKISIEDQENEAKKKPDRKEENEFDKKVDDFKLEIQELSSQLNQVGIEIKNNEATLKEIPVSKIKEDSNLEHGKAKTELKNGANPKNGSLFLKLGQNEVKITDEHNPSKLLPLPIAISNNSKKNASKSVITNGDEGNSLEKHANEEVQAMRRDILSLSTN